MDSGDAIIGAIIAGMIALNLFLVYLAYATFNILVGCDGIGAIVGYGLLFIILCVAELFVLTITVGMLVAIVD